LMTPIAVVRPYLDDGTMFNLACLLEQGVSGAYEFQP
jgi:hypothetical protein